MLHVYMICGLSIIQGIIVAPAMMLWPNTCCKLDNILGSIPGQVGQPDLERRFFHDKGVG